MSGNLFDRNVDVPAGGEVLENILHNKQIRLRRIVSNNHCSAHGFWYDQQEDEFVVVLEGAAKLEFEDKTVTLGPGDWAHIPARQKHRVASTAEDELTVWLAVFWFPDP